MSLSDVVPEDARDEFWAVVRDCLREFHGISVGTAQRKARLLRKSVEARSDDAVMMFYHDEPWYVACSLARQKLDAEEHAERYLYLRDTKHGFVAPQQPVPPVRTAPLPAVKPRSKALAGSK